MRSQNILIFGGGSVGLGLASCLLKAGAQVSIVARPSTVASLNSHGLQRTGIFGEHVAPPGQFTACGALEDLPLQDYDYILVCVKSTDTRSAAELLAARGAPLESARIVLCQNGWGNAEIFHEFFESAAIYSARVITGFCRPQPHEVKITVHADAIHMGHLGQPHDGHLDAICDAITDGGIPCVATDTIAEDLWAKMLYNCALNPLGAVLGVHYGRLGEKPETRAFMDDLIHETFGVMCAAGYRTHWESPEAYITVFYDSQLPATFWHESSMLQDLRAHKKTEIDALTGQVIALANQQDVPIPHTDDVYRLVKFLECDGR